MPHVIVLPQVIERKLKENERQEVINFINGLFTETAGEVKRDVIETVEEKFERRLSEEIAGLKIELTEKIASNKVEMIKWMFIFWIGNVITIIGGIMGILKIAKVF
jgi:hypothetical protein